MTNSLVDVGRVLSCFLLDLDEEEGEGTWRDVRNLSVEVVVRRSVWRVGWVGIFFKCVWWRMRKMNGVK